MPEFTYEIVRHVGVISEGSGGWQKELNLISWNGKEPKYDIRDWGPEHKKMGKGKKEDDVPTARPVDSRKTVKSSLDEAADVDESMF